MYGDGPIFQDLVWRWIYFQMYKELETENITYIVMLKLLWVPSLPSSTTLKTKVDVNNFIFITETGIGRIGPL